MVLQDKILWWWRWLLSRTEKLGIYFCGACSRKALLPPGGIIGKYTPAAQAKWFKALKMHPFVLVKNRWENSEILWGHKLVNVVKIKWLKTKYLFLLYKPLYASPLWGCFNWIIDINELIKRYELFWLLFIVYDKDSLFWC